MLNELATINIVINLEGNNEVIIKKITGRRICPVCNKNFNITDINSDGYVMPPMLPSGDDPTVCDGDHGKQIKLISREDDKEETIR